MTTTIAPQTTGRSLIQSAESLTPVLRASAAAIESGRCLTPEVHAAVLDAGFYRMTMPLEFGATDISLAETMRVLEALATGDASTAWTVWAGLGVPAMSAFMLAEGSRELFSAPDAMTSGSVAGIGAARPVEGGYRVSGRWPFVSGIKQATYSGGICFVFDGEAQRFGPDGQPAILVALWPIGDCLVIDNWDSTGLRGTGSHDIAVEDLFVPEIRIVDFSREPRMGLRPVHYLDVDKAANLTVASIALGVAAAAVEAFKAIAPNKRSPEGAVLVDSPLAKIALGVAETRLAQARGHLYETAESMTEGMPEGGLPGDEWFRRTALASTGAVDASVEVITSLYRAAGTSAVRSGLLDRCLRDIFTLQAHKTVNHQNILKYGTAGITG